MDIIHFKPEEFNCPEHTYGCMSEELLEKLELARKYSNIPFVITSAFRTKEQNKAVGGVEDSSHLRGMAVDISVLTGSQRYIILTSLIDAGFTRIGIGKTFIHVDVDKSKPQNVVWVY